MTAASRENVDVVVAGGGPAGLIAAAALAAQGVQVLLADPGPAPATSARGDLRSTAFLHAARDLLCRIGLWDRLEPQAVPLDGLRMVDLEAGDPPAVRAERVFRDAGGGPLAWNFSNDVIRQTVAAHLAALPNVELAFGQGVLRATLREAEALLVLDGGRQVAARLVVAADGRESRPAPGGRDRRPRDALRAEGAGLCRGP